MGQKLSSAWSASYAISESSKKQAFKYLVGALLLSASFYAMFTFRFPLLGLSRLKWVKTFLISFRKDHSELEKRCRLIERDIYSKNEGNVAIVKTYTEDTIVHDHGIPFVC